MYKYLPDMTPHFTSDGRTTRIHACKWQVSTVQCKHHTALFLQNLTVLASMSVLGTGGVLGGRNGKALTLSDILWLFGLGKCLFVREKL